MAAVTEEEALFAGFDNVQLAAPILFRVRVTAKHQYESTGRTIRLFDFVNDRSWEQPVSVEQFDAVSVRDFLEVKIG